MSSPNSVHVELLLGELKQVLKLDPNNVAAFCRIGVKLAGFGRASDVRRCYRAAVEVLLRHIRAGDAEAALAVEKLIYENFLKLDESEEHYERCFADWRDESARLGLRFRQAAEGSGHDARRVALFLHAGYMLGHTEVLFNVLETLKARGTIPAEVRLYVLMESTAEFIERAKRLGVEVVLVETRLPGGRAAPLLERFKWLRDHLRQERFGVLVWVTAPLWAPFALSMRLAPVQVFWAMRFHPVRGPDIDGYITWGGRDETVRRYGDQDWRVVPLPFAFDDSPVPRPKIDELRARFPEPVLLGTLAREDKINSAAFLQSVADTLSAHPQAGFVWTGRNEHPAITAFFRKSGVAERCHFVGWVDTKLYAAALDAFLDTFPHGCGITSYHAFAASTPLLSYLGPATIFGTHFWKHVAGDSGESGAAAQPRLAAADEHAILCARDAAEYVALAGRLVTDAAWRAQIGARGRAFFEEELGSNEEYARRFFETVSQVAAAKLESPLPPLEKGGVAVEG